MKTFSFFHLVTSNVYSEMLVNNKYILIYILTFSLPYMYCVYRAVINNNNNNNKYLIILLLY